jgi:peptidoglycan hydrolase-like protein with peptidoglycan-binding domain
MRNIKSGAIVVTLLAGTSIGLAPAWGAGQYTNKPSQQVQEGARPGTASHPGTPNSDRIMKVQQSLKDDGFYSGSVDGVNGQKTREAIRAFQKSKNLNATGTIDDATARELGLQ